jgi:hypothetical protein
MLKISISVMTLILLALGTISCGGGSDASTATAEDTAEIKSAIRSFFSAMNSYDHEAVQSMLAPDGAAWMATLAYSESMKLNMSVDDIGEPRINGDHCTVSVTTTVKSGAGMTPENPTSTEDMLLAKVAGKWLMSDD